MYRSPRTRRPPRPCRPPPRARSYPLTAAPASCAARFRRAPPTVPAPAPPAPRRPLRPPSSGGQELAGVHHPGGVEAVLQGVQNVEPELADLGAHVGRMVLADGVVMGDRAGGGDDRLARGCLCLAP